MSAIYLDYNATTPLDPAVVEAMLPFLRDHFGNPSSQHEYGQRAHNAAETARKQVADLINALPEEIIFTSGGTEASNHALKGAIFAKFHGLFGRWARGAQIVTSVIEHPATLMPCEFLERFGCKIIKVPVDGAGRIDPDVVEKTALRGTTVLSLMHANNEVGTLQPIREITEVARARGIVVHTDAAQSLGKIKVDVRELGVDLLTIAGHKVYAPKGVGVLYVRKGVRLESLLHGADHESNRRAGTENVPYIVGLGKACEIAGAGLPAATDRLRQLRDRLWERLRAKLGDGIVLNGHPEQRLPNTLNVSFVGHVGGELLERTPEVAASLGSACHAGKVKLSPVLCAMGITPDLSKAAVRLSVGRFTTEDEVDRAADALLRSAIAVS